MISFSTPETGARRVPYILVPKRAFRLCAVLGVVLGLLFLTTGITAQAQAQNPDSPFIKPGLYFGWLPETTPSPLQREWSVELLRYQEPSKPTAAPRRVAVSTQTSDSLNDNEAELLLLKLLALGAVEEAAHDFQARLNARAQPHGPDWVKTGFRALVLGDMIDAACITLESLETRTSPGFENEKALCRAAASANETPQALAKILDKDKNLNIDAAHWKQTPPLFRAAALALALGTSDTSPDTLKDDFIEDLNPAELFVLIHNTDLPASWRLRSAMHSLRNSFPGPEKLSEIFMLYPAAQDPLSLKSTVRNIRNAGRPEEALARAFQALHALEKLELSENSTDEETFRNARLSYLDLALDAAEKTTESALYPFLPFALQVDAKHIPVSQGLRWLALAMPYADSAKYIEKRATRISAKAKIWTENLIGSLNQKTAPGKALGPEESRGVTWPLLLWTGDKRKAGLEDPESWTAWRQNMIIRYPGKGPEGGLARALRLQNILSHQASGVPEFGDHEKLLENLTSFDNYVMPSHLFIEGLRPATQSRDDEKWLTQKERLKYKGLMLMHGLHPKRLHENALIRFTQALRSANMEKSADGIAQTAILPVYR